MTLSEYRLGLKAYYLEHEKDFAEAYGSADRWLRDVCIENEYKKTLNETVPYNWFSGDRVVYEKLIRGIDEYGFSSDVIEFVGPFSDIVE